MMTHARWAEFDIGKATWVIPARSGRERRPGMKGRKDDFRVPLSDSVVTLLKTLPQPTSGDALHIQR